MLTYEAGLALPDRFVYDFYSQGCQPCLQMMKILPKWSADTSVAVVKVDIEAFPEMAQGFNIRRVPTFVYMESGQETNRIVGVPRLLDLTELVGAG